MKTEYTIYRPGASEPESHTVELPAEPTYDQLSALVRPLLNGGWIERVRVLLNANDPEAEPEYSDMFVDEDGHLKNLPRNDAATALYRANWLKQHPGTPPESLPVIVGVAIVFSRPVWF